MEINQVTTIFLAIILLLLGTYLIKKVRILDRFSIPAPVVGGLLFAILVLILNSFNVVEISLDTSLQELFMLVFFTTVGLGASFTLIKKGGKLLIVYLIVVGFLSLLQNSLGAAMAKLFGIDPLIGVMSGSISMIGGHGGAAAFGETFEGLGVEGALTAGIASATFGLIAGGLVGGPIARYLLNKNKLEYKKEDTLEETPVESEERLQKFSTNQFFIHLGIIAFSMSLGAFLGDKFSSLTGFVLPNYVGAMFVAVIVRSIIDYSKNTIRINFDVSVNDLIGSVALGIFLSMALMSIKLWEIIDLALPLLVILILQVLLITFLAIFIAFRVLGKNYDAAVMVGGMAGHGLGATPTAMANMDTITQKYGPSRTAFLIVPIVGAFLIDTINIPIILFFMNYFN